MSVGGLVACGVIIAFGLVGCIIQLYPGSLVILATMGVWAFIEGVAAGWIAFALAAVVTAGATIAKFLIPARRMRSRGVSTTTLLIGAAAGAVGFFVLPIIGLPIGFLLGVYAREIMVHPHAEAVERTKIAVRGVGLSIAIEFAAGLIAAITWLIAALIIHV
ncbi:MAG: DUF456 domain-containing protein [Flaviflexus sp.]|nr:DUF456 domain-containing protein [Flaviflexus sp.]